MAAASRSQHARRRRSRPTSVASTRAAAAAALLVVAIAGAVGAPPPPPKAAPPAPAPKAPASDALPPGELPPVYGNYCGYQNSSCEDASFRKKPIDLLDAACLAHDKCWCRSGRMDCACDKALLQSARGLLRASNGNGTRAAAPLPASTAAMAAAVTAYFSVAPCVCRERRFCLPTCGARSGCSWGGPNCRQAVSPGLGGVCALRKK